VYAPRFRPGAGPPRPPDRGPVKPRRPAVPLAQAAAGRPPAPPDFASQAQAQVSAQIDPILRYITNRYNQQAQGVSGAIGGLTNTYASRLAGLAAGTGAMYDQAKAPVSAAAAGINAQLTQLGRSSAQAEAAAAARAGLPAGGQSPDINLAAGGAGAGGAAGAIGDAAINALAQEQKAAMEYAGKLPGFAQLEGQYQTRSVLSQLAAEMADQLAQTTAQAPQLYWTIYQSLLDRAQTDKQLAEQVREFNVQQNAARAQIEGRWAPTLGGRQAYWDKEAARRTADLGDVYVGTTTGLRPLDADPRKPGIQRVRSQQGQAGDYLNLGRQASATATIKRADIAQQNANTAAARAATAAKQAAAKEAHRHAEAVRRLQIAEQNAKTAEQRAAIQRRQAAETRRHHLASEQIARMKKQKQKQKSSGSFNPPSGNYGP
jgi:hypothetical protein